MTSIQTDKINVDMRQKIQQLMQQQGLGVLSTKDEDGHPYASLIAFAPDQENAQLFFVTPKATRKYANLSHDPRVALLINNSANDPSDFHMATAVTVLGQAQPVENHQKEDILALFLEKHPYLRQFANSPSCALMAIQITGFTMVQQFQNVSELWLNRELDSDI